MKLKVMMLGDGPSALWWSDAAEVDAEMAEYGHLQAIQFVATYHPDPEQREMWCSLWFGELAVRGLRR